MKKDIINQKIKKIEEGKKIKIEKKIEKNQKFGYLIILSSLHSILVVFTLYNAVRH